MRRGEGLKGPRGTLWELSSDGIMETGDAHCWTQLDSGTEKVTWCQRH